MPDRLYQAAAETNAATVRIAEAFAAMLSALARRGGSATAVVPAVARVMRYLAERERIRLSRIVLLTALETADTKRRPAADRLQSENLHLERRLHAAVRRALEAIRVTAPHALPDFGLDELQRTFAAIQALLSGPQRRPPAPPWLAGAVRLRPPVYTAARQAATRQAERQAARQAAPRAIAPHTAIPVRGRRRHRGNR